MIRQLTKAEIWAANNRAETAAKRALPVGERLVMKRELKKGDVTPEGFTVQYVDKDGRVYVDQKNLNAVPPSTEPTTKRAEGAEGKTVKKSMFGNLINRDGIGEGVERVTKAADICEYELVPGIGLRRVDPNIVLDSPKPTDAKRSPENPASSFPRSSSIVDRDVRPSDDSVRPIVGPYAMVEGSEVDLTSAGTLPASTFLGVRRTVKINKPAMFSPTQPKDRDFTDDVTPPDFDGDDDVDPWDLTDSDRDPNDTQKSTKSIRLGLGYIFKRQYKGRA